MFKKCCIFTFVEFEIEYVDNICVCKKTFVHTYTVGSDESNQFRGTKKEYTFFEGKEYEFDYTPLTEGAKMRVEPPDEHYTIFATDFNCRPDDVAIFQCPEQFYQHFEKVGFILRNNFKITEGN